MTAHGAQGQDFSTARSRAARLAVAACAVFAIAVFALLGTWQVFRLQWKLALIERVTQRVHASPVPAPARDEWPRITADTAEYRHVELTGTFLPGTTTRVQAATELGAGYWILTAMRTDNGDTVFVNRGFVPSGTPADAGRAGEGSHATVTGLLRMNEPGGGFLRHNDPAGNRWYSRDVAAIGAARGLSRVAPYFVDADAAPAVAGLPPDPARPIGGLTVVKFHNNHLVYAATWYALALMAAGAWYLVGQSDRRQPERNARGTWRAILTRRNIGTA